LLHGFIVILLLLVVVIANCKFGMLVYLDLHTGVSRWRERLTERWGGRWKGVWDSTLIRETLVLRDGRHLTYFLDGPYDRKNYTHIFVFHAMFLSGNSFLMREAPRDYVLVCVNRPGYFGSSQVDLEDYTYDSFARDMEQLADHLQLETFIVAGHSSGGPCSLACAARLPRRVTAVAILSGDPEYAHEGVPDKRPINAFCLGKCLPWTLSYVLCCLPMARNGVHGLKNDYRLETSIYSFRTESVQQPVIVFAGESDKVLPLEVSRHVHERLDHAHLRVVANVGHMGLLRDDILRDLFETAIALAEERKPIEQNIQNENEEAESATAVEMV
jgi:pimeloyl-ACP methyl ester carboxylesterase